MLCGLVPQAGAQPTAPAAPPAFEIDVQAPEHVRDYLLRHLELQRYREIPDLDDGELARLAIAAEQQARELLGTLGYFNPELQASVVPASPGASPGALRRVLISAAPGAPTTVTEVTIDFSGPIADDAGAAAQRDAIRKDWLLSVGRPFTQAEWDAAKAQALRQLTARRFPTGEIGASQADIDPETHTARLHITLASGPAFRFGPLLITGMTRYDADLIPRLARLLPGEPYDQNRLLEAQQRLSSSGFFDSVFMTLDTSGDPENAPVQVQLREAKLQRVVLGVGASTDGGPRLSVEHRHLRLPWLGWRAVSKLTVDRTTQSLGAELTAPPDADYWRWIGSALVQHQQSGDVQTNSLRLRAGRTQTGERIDRNYYLQYDRAHDSGPDVDTVAQAVSANYAWTQRNFDSVPFPSRGYGLSAELGGGFTLGSDRQPYVRTLVRWLGYQPLGQVAREPGAPLVRRDRLALRVEGGAVLARASAQIPSTQLFLTGGDTTVRGYGLRDIGVPQASGEVLAGRYLAVGSVEWQRPIVRDGRATDWEHTVFIDAGAVADKPGDLRAKVGIGTGARWRSPVGPLQVDLAYGVATRRLRLHLSVGFTF